MDDQQSNYSRNTRRTEADAGLIDYNRRLKQMQERILIRQYNSRLSKNNEDKSKQLQNKQLEKQQLHQSLQAYEEHAAQLRRQRQAQRDILGNEYDHMIAQRQRRSEQEEAQRIEIQKKIVERKLQQDIIERINNKKKKQIPDQASQDFKKQVEQDVQEKQRYRSSEREAVQAQQRSYRESVAENARRQMFYEQSQRRYFKQFNEAENKRLLTNLNSARDSLTDQLSELEQQKNRQTHGDLANNDSQLRYKDTIRKLEQAEYKQGLDIQVIEKHMRRQKQQKQRSSSAYPNETAPTAYNPIINPLPIQRKNPNVMRLLQMGDPQGLQ